MHKIDRDRNRNERIRNFLPERSRGSCKRRGICGKEVPNQPALSEEEYKSITRSINSQVTFGNVSL